MKLIATTLAVIMAFAATVSATGSYSITAFSFESCSTSSSLIQTTAGTQAAGDACIPLAFSMASVILVMNGTCDMATFYSDAQCSTVIDTDNGSPFNIGCQTFSNGPFRSARVIC